jgi:hypothetical protein
MVGDAHSSWCRFADKWTDGERLPASRIDPRVKGAAMPLWDLFWAMFLFFLFVMWIWLLFAVFADLFRSAMSGWKKALWTVVLIVMPFLGVLVYLIAHGGTMQDRSTRHAIGMGRAQDDYIRTVGGSYSNAGDMTGWPSGTYRR